VRDIRFVERKSVPPAHALRNVEAGSAPPTKLGPNAMLQPQSPVQRAHDDPFEQSASTLPAIPARVRWIDRRTAVKGEEFARAVRAGLTAQPKYLDCVWFYDAAGSELFEQICDCPEYYLTRAEHEILTERAFEIVAACPARTSLVELGSGNAAKTRLLIRALLARQGSLVYVPIDVSRTALDSSARALVAEQARLEVVAIAAEYETGVRELRALELGPKLLLWLGSNVGNLSREAAASFLARLREGLGADDRLLIGIDLRKDRATLERAYDDAAGVTARFNLNLLARIDRELGGGFGRARFAHRAVYDEGIGRMDMYLESLAAQRVRIDALDLEVDFAAGERIHSESSYKYSTREIEALADAAGWRVEDLWLDGRERFALARFAPRQEPV
jgi:L-histidine N-alpha-methyltransferase